MEDGGHERNVVCEKCGECRTDPVHGFTCARVAALNERRREILEAARVGVCHASDGAGALCVRPKGHDGRHRNVSVKVREFGPSSEPMRPGVLTPRPGEPPEESAAHPDAGSLDETRPWPRLRVCVEAWPECRDGKYDPRCCRFPKSCSCGVYDREYLAEGDLEDVTA